MSTSESPGDTEATLSRRSREPSATAGAKTIAAAALALVFGVSALFSVLTLILSTVGLVLGIIGIILGIVGLKMANRTGVTGKSVATAGLILSIIAVLLAVAFAVGVSTFLNDRDAVDWLQQQVNQLRDDLPT
jgi:ABC-type phosphate transport system permease subunit